MQKTRVVDFRKPSRPEDKPGSFDFLGFTHYWGRSRDGRMICKLKTAKDRLARSCRAVWEWCRKHLHQRVDEQCRGLNWKLRGHYSYYGMTHNTRSLRQYYLTVCRTWFRWLCRRGNGRILTWEAFATLLTRHPLALPRIVHNLYQTV